MSRAAVSRLARAARAAAAARRHHAGGRDPLPLPLRALASLAGDASASAGGGGARRPAWFAPPMGRLPAAGSGGGGGLLVPPRRLLRPTQAARYCTSSSSQITPGEFTEMAWEGVVGAVVAARMSKQQVVEAEHLMKALLEQKDGLALRIFLKAGIDNTSILQATDEFISRQPKVVGDTSGPIIGSSFVSILDNARKHKKEYGDEFVSVEHILRAFTADKRFGQQLFRDLKIGENELKEAISAVRGSQRVTDQNPEGKYQALEKYGIDMTELARRGKLDPVICRDDEVRRCIQILCRRTKNNPVIIGEPGVGKTAIAEGLAQRIVRGDVPEPLQNRKLISLDMGALLAGAKFQGQFEERLKAVLKEVTASNGQIILVIDEINTIVGAGLYI